MTARRIATVHLMAREDGTYRLTVGTWEQPHRLQDYVMEWHGDVPRAALGGNPSVSSVVMSALAWVQENC